MPSPTSWVGLWTCRALGLEHFVSPLPLTNFSSSLSAQLPRPCMGNCGATRRARLGLQCAPFVWVALVSWKLFILLHPQVYDKIFKGWEQIACALYPSNLACSKCSMPIFRQKERRDQSISIYPQGQVDLRSQRNCDKTLPEWMADADTAQTIATER